MKKLTYLLFFMAGLVSCNRVKQNAKEAVNKSGEAVGKTATEFVEGVTEGVDRTLDCNIEISQPLKDKGIDHGKFSINDSAGGHKNMLTLYIIFNQDFKGNVMARAFDKTGLEEGRATLAIQGNAGEARYYDFLFDKRTEIEVKSKITLE